MICSNGFTRWGAQIPDLGLIPKTTGPQMQPPTPSPQIPTGRRLVTFQGGLMVLNAKDDGTVVVERTVNKNAGRVKFDMEDVLRAAYGQPDEVFTYQGGELLPPPTQLPDPLESGDKVDVREYLLFLDAYFTTLRMTEGAGATGAAALADAYTIMRKEYGKTRREGL